jgi:hypothetical protein
MRYFCTECHHGIHRLYAEVQQMSCEVVELEPPSQKRSTSAPYLLVE